MRETVFSVCTLAKRGDSMTLRRMKRPTRTRKIPRRNGTRHPQERSSFSGSLEKKKKTAVERKRPAGTPAWGQLA
jgi:hypothetical protein